ncbi:DnaJ domain-containing protein [Helicobacter sp. 16-1353]|uniref:DnaJ domain-containing protein n=1 Tax=Helicobacter sp. 16-1353 TaxID=2004996 RepID=UPI0023EEC401|nr:DnaJ domain-containing protein [Helicobacter sp. 16-1353]
MEKIGYVFNNIFLIFIYMVFGAIIGAIAGKIIIYFVDIDVFKLVFSVVIGMSIGMIVASMIRFNYSSLLGAIIGAFIGFVFHNLFNDINLYLIYFFNIDAYINPEKNSSYGIVYGLSAGAVSGIFIFILKPIELMIEKIKRNKKENNYEVTQKLDTNPQITRTKLLDTKKENTIKQKEESKDSLDPYLSALNTSFGMALALSSKVATKYHKTLDNNYIESLLNIFGSNTMNIDKIYQDIIENEKNKFQNVNLLCVNLKKLSNTHKDKEAFIRLLLEMALSDGDYEDDIIFQIALNINMDTESYFALKREFRQDSNIQDSLDSDNKDSSDIDLIILYDVLEVLPNDDNQTIKKSYRRLAAKYHPDKYISKELPEDMVKFAEQRFKDINYAYDILKKLRNII